LEKKNLTNEYTDLSLSLRFKDDLLRHNIKLDSAPKLDDVVLKLPTMRGKNIEEHFHSIASDQTRPYTNLVNSLLCKLPDKPTVSVLRDHSCKNLTDRFLQN
jgi:hypothetical protein